MKEAVVFGAGSVGRGFIGQLFCEAGYRVTFLDVARDLVDVLARDGSYPHVTVSNESSVRTTVAPVTAVDARNIDEAVAALAAADVAATAVGARVLPTLAPTHARSLRRRIAHGRAPLNLLLCENLHGAAGIMRELLAEQLPDLGPRVLDENLGLVETSIGRMIPVPQGAVLASEPTVIFAEPYKELPYDAAAVRGEPLHVPGLLADPGVRFSFYGDRKLYIHNMGHAFTAYLGEQEQVTTIAEAIGIPSVRSVVRAAMAESAVALSLIYRRPLGDLMEHVDDLIHRFGNRALGDTVERVGRDPARKMSGGDRLLGAYLAAVSQRSPTRHLSLAVAVGAEALRRREHWTDEMVSAHLERELRQAALSEDQQHLLAAQLRGLAEGRGLTWQIELIEHGCEAPVAGVGDPAPEQPSQIPSGHPGCERTLPGREPVIGGTGSPGGSSSIQVAGHVCVDLAPSLGSSGVANAGELAEVGPMRISVGGAVGNCGRALSRIGVAVSLSAAVGDDDLGALCLRMLQDRHGDAVELTVVPGVATSYSVVVEPEGVDRSFWHHTGANDLFTGECAITASQLLHYGYPSLTPAMCARDGEPIARLFHRARSQGVATSLDLAFLAANSPLRSLKWEALLRAVLPTCDVFCPSWDDLASSLGVPACAGIVTVAEWAQRFVDWGAGVVLITLGDKGVYLKTAAADRLSTLAACRIDTGDWADAELWMESETLEGVVTTNGAGDTYKAAFLARLATGSSPADCLRYAREIVGRHITGRALLDVSAAT